MQPAPESPAGPESDFGILMAPVDGKGTWAALKELRAALRKVRAAGTAKIIFVDALDEEGRAVDLHDPRLAALVIGYSLKPRSNRDASTSSL